MKQTDVCFLIADVIIPCSYLICEHVFNKVKVKKYIRTILVKMVFPVYNNVTNNVRV